MLHPVLALSPRIFDAKDRPAVPMVRNSCFHRGLAAPDTIVSFPRCRGLDCRDGFHQHAVQVVRTKAHPYTYLQVALCTFWGGGGLTPEYLRLPCKKFVVPQERPGRTRNTEESNFQSAEPHAILASSLERCKCLSYCALFNEAASRWGTVNPARGLSQKENT